jgi:hypothetical protein
MITTRSPGARVCPQPNYDNFRFADGPEVLSVKE